MPGSRAAELAANLAAVEHRIAGACAAAGRRREEVALLAVTKTWPASDAALLRDLGLRDLGENRDQEARQKAAAVPGVRWHFIGQLQSNKAASVASYAAVVHSLDRPSLCAALDAGAQAAGRVVDVLIQVSLDGDPTRGGALPEAVAALAEQVKGCAGLRLGGLSAVAPLAEDPAVAFARLQRFSAALVLRNPHATTLSAGMSGDLEQAVAAGSTCVRVGTALLGARTAPLR